MPATWGCTRNIAIGATGFFLLALSMTSIALPQVAKTIWKSDNAENTGSGVGNICDSCTLDHKPAHFEDSTLPLITAAGALSIFALLLGIHSAASKIIFTGLLGTLIGTVLPLATLINSMVKYHKSDTRWEYYDPQSSDRHFTFESWTCSLTNAHAFATHPSYQRDFARMCNLSVMPSLPSPRRSCYRS